MDEGQVEAEVEVVGAATSSNVWTEELGAGVQRGWEGDCVAHNLASTALEGSFSYIRVWLDPRYGEKGVCGCSSG